MGVVATVGGDTVVFTVGGGTSRECVILIVGGVTVAFNTGGAPTGFTDDRTGRTERISCEVCLTEEYKS